jgi:outer membrane protein OmpA-like peptidoglycan-associated protein
MPESSPGRGWHAMFTKMGERVMRRGKSPTILKHLRISGAVLALAGAAMASPAQADGGKDCPPVGSLPGYAASEAPQHFAYQGADFTVKKGDDTATVKVAGRYCMQSYAPTGDAMSDLEIQDNYRNQLDGLGAETLFTDDRDTVAKLDKDGKETWILVYSQETEIDVTVVEKQAVKQTLTGSTGKDYRLLGHMPEYVAGDVNKKKFDQDTFTVQDGDGTKDVNVQGALYQVSYEPKDMSRTSSDLEIQENYRTALKALGAEILYTDDRNTVARLDDKGQDIWIKVYSQETEIDLSSVEEKPFQASIKPPKADAMKSALDEKGVVSLYINFDFDKATLRPDAAPVIGQVEALLKDAPDLRLDIEGNTDNVGGHDYNVVLSQKRAETVVAVLEKDGIAADRLKATGNGPDKPIADNGDSRGRAKNRRVDLVKM